ncbi:lipoate--protein ligase [Acholeplasma granularum]|uniref:lipoate--protein ligase n=1 Tax=Acholeplasma granularum TaxID=264635 RepID=UPI000472C223|nr:lipoate--protein ligase [Acholeplasma granularum]
MILVKHNNEGNLEPYFYFALEKYVLEHLLKDDETYFFTWRIKGIVSGKNQVIENEINFPYVKENKIKFFRRPTGGGSVYADENNTMFTIITKRGNQNFSFKKYLEKITEAFKKIGVNLEFSGRNDILLDGKKVSGNAFLQNKYGMLMHGTLMYDLDIETMVRALNPPDEKLISKGIDSVRSRVNNLKPYLNGMSHDALVDYLENELTNQIYILSDSEINQLMEDAKLYSSEEWLYRSQPEYTQKLSKRFDWGVLDMRFNIKQGIIKDISISGDFFEITENLDELKKLFINQEWSYESIKNILSKIDLKDIILNSKNEDLLVLFENAFINN